MDQVPHNYKLPIAASLAVLVPSFIGLIYFLTHV